MLATETTAGGDVLADAAPSQTSAGATAERSEMIFRSYEQPGSSVTADHAARQRPLALDPSSIDPRAEGRQIAAMTPAAERAALYAEQQRLAIKKVTELLTPAEERRLKIVRWNIDRIEDAEFGTEIDALDVRANMVERLAANVRGFVAEARKYQRR